MASAARDRRSLAASLVRSVSIGTPIASETASRLASVRAAPSPKRIGQGASVAATSKTVEYETTISSERLPVAVATTVASRWPNPIEPDAGNTSTRLPVGVSSGTTRGSGQPDVPLYATAHRRQVLDGDRARRQARAVPLPAVPEIGGGEGGRAPLGVLLRGQAVKCATCHRTDATVYVTASYQTGTLTFCSSCHVAWLRHGGEEQADRDAKAAAADMPPAAKRKASR